MRIGHAVRGLELVKAAALIGRERDRDGAAGRLADLESEVRSGVVGHRSENIFRIVGIPVAVGIGGTGNGCVGAEVVGGPPTRDHSIGRSILAHVVRPLHGIGDDVAVGFACVIINDNVAARSAGEIKIGGQRLPAPAIDGLVDAVNQFVGRPGNIHLGIGRKIGANGIPDRNVVVSRRRNIGGVGGRGRWVVGGGIGELIVSAVDGGAHGSARPVPRSVGGITRIQDQGISRREAAIGGIERGTDQRIDLEVIIGIAQQARQQNDMLGRDAGHERGQAAVGGRQAVPHLRGGREAGFPGDKCAAGQGGHDHVADDRQRQRDRRNQPGRIVGQVAVKIRARDDRSIGGLARGKSGRRHHDRKGLVRAHWPHDDDDRIRGNRIAR